MRPSLSWGNTSSYRAIERTPRGGLPVGFQGYRFKMAHIRDGVFRTPGRAAFVPPRLCQSRQTSPPQAVYHAGARTILGNRRLPRWCPAIPKAASSSRRLCPEPFGSRSWRATRLKRQAKRLGADKDARVCIRNAPKGPRPASFSEPPGRTYLAVSSSADCTSGAGLSWSKGTHPDKEDGDRNKMPGCWSG